MTALIIAKAIKRSISHNEMRHDQHTKAAAAEIEALLCLEIALRAPDGRRVISHERQTLMAARDSYRRWLSLERQRHAVLGAASRRNGLSLANEAHLDSLRDAMQRQTSANDLVCVISEARRTRALWGA